MKKVIFLILAGLLVLSGCGSKAAETTPPMNAESSISCSVTQGFNFEKDVQITFGYVNYLKIAGQEIAADLTVADPQDPVGTLNVCGVISGIYWHGGYSDAVMFTAQVSTTNKNTLATMIHKSMANTETEFSFTVYDYDFDTKVYFKSFHTDSVILKGLIMKSGGDLALNIAMDASYEVESPKNYSMSLGVMPQTSIIRYIWLFSYSER